MSFPMMLAASLALHIGVVGGVALYYFWGNSSSASASLAPEKSATVTLIRSAEARVASHLSPGTSQPSAPVFASTSTAQPLLPAPAKLRPVAAPLAESHEANPNAHVQALPPEAILSPVPPPILNSANGVVFILDVSGSMYEPYAGSTRLAFAREAVGQRIRALKDGTPFAITLYAQRALTSGPLVAASDATREAAVRFIERDVDCGGGTNLPAGLAAAQQLRPGALVLASDGDLNISAVNLVKRATSILGEKGRCAHLEIVGIAPRADAGDEQLLADLADSQGGDYEAEAATGPSQLVTSAANVTKAADTTP